MSGRPKLSQLFHQGVELVVPTPVGDLVFWVSKLNSFLVEECNHQGRLASSRRRLAIRDIGTPEYEEFMLSATTLDAEAIIAGVVKAKHSDLMFEVWQDLHSDKDWAEKLETIENSDGIEAKSKDDPEVLWLLKSVEDYTAEMDRRLKDLEEEYANELRDLTPEQLQERYSDLYIEMQGNRVFTATRRRYELYLAARECEAELPAEGGHWDHSKCDHSRRLMGSPEEVDALPDEVIKAINDTYDALMVPSDLARFTAGPTSSSDSSGPASSAEGSEPSGPKATRKRPATTSSSRSAKPSRRSATSSSRKTSNPPS